MCISNFLTRANDVALWQSSGLTCTKFNLQDCRGKEKKEGWEVIQRNVTRIKTNYNGFDSNRVKKEKTFDILLKIITLIYLNSIDFDTSIKEILDNKYS